MALFHCCLLPIIIRYVLYGLSFSLLDSTQNKMSVRQSLKVETDSCQFDCEIMISNDLAERRSI